MFKTAKDITNISSNTVAQKGSRTFFKPSIQPCLNINQPHDIYEQEANAMAEKLIHMPVNESKQAPFFKPAISALQRKCEHCEEEEKKMQRKEMNENKMVADNTLENYTNNLNGNSGNGLPDEVRNFYEPRFAYDFSNVRIHNDQAAAKSAQSINALAYTSENNIVFNSGQYSTGTNDGKRLLGHELTHVVQQKGGNYGNSNPVHQRVISNPILRKANPAPDITDAEVVTAISWAASTQLGQEAIKELQGALSTTLTGIYDESTARAVFAKQREWKPLGTISRAGQANPAMYRHLGLISTKTITPATVDDPNFESIRRLFPDGITVAICPKFKSSIHGHAEFLLQAGIFAKNQNAVGLSPTGAIQIGVPVFIKELGDVIEAVEGIHRGLLQKNQDAVQASGANEAASAPEPLFTRIKNLALFSHGESWGIGLNESNAFMGGGLHNRDSADNPANLVAFVRGISDAIIPGIRIELFACSAAHDPTRVSYDEWTKHTQGDRAGSTSFAASLATAFGSESTVSGHSTVGHTTENYAARVFGAESGGEGGIHIFDILYDEAFIQSELVRLFPGKTSDELALLHDSLREQMWSHYKDSVQAERSRSAAHKRYTVPIGQEMFVNPENAKALLHADWTTNWIPEKLKLVKPPHVGKHK